MTNDSSRQPARKPAPATSHEPTPAPPLTLEILEDRTVPTVFDLTGSTTLAVINNAIFRAELPGGSSGSGVLAPFLRLQNNPTEQGYNTDTPRIQSGMDTKTGTWTHALQLSQVPIVNITVNGTSSPYAEFLLDLNETSSKISLDELQFFLGTAGNLSNYNTTSETLSGATAPPGGLPGQAVWDLDLKAGNNPGNTVLLTAANSTGSGRADLFLYVPASVLGNWDGSHWTDGTKYVYMFSKFGTETINGVLNADSIASDGGFEEWSVGKGQAGPAPISTAPLAFDDAYTTAEDQTLTVAAPGVLGNDSDPQNQKLTAVLVSGSGPAHGTVSLDSTGSFVYTPNTGYSGSDSFKYYAVDPDGNKSNDAKVTITISHVNHAPVLSDTTDPAPVVELLDASAQNLAAITGSFPVSDLDVGDALTPSVVGSPVVKLDGVAFALPAGALPLVAPGAFTLTGTTSNGGSVSVMYTYDPGPAALDFLRAGQALTITYTVKVNDGTADSGTQDVTFTITGTNDAPTGKDNTVSTLEDKPYQFAAADFGFTDPKDTPPNTFQAVMISTLPLAGSLTLDGAAVTAGQFVSQASLDAGSLVFTPAGNANGSPYATFTFQVQDDGGTANGGADLDPAARTMTINVTPVDDPPVANADAAIVAEDSGATAIDVLANDTDPDNLTGPANAGLAVTAVTQGAYGGAVSFTATGVTYTPAANYYGPDSFTYTVTDPTGLTATATVSITVTPVNDAPAAANDAYSTDEDKALTVATPGVLANDSDTDGDKLTAVLFGTAPDGLTLSGDGSFTYNPPANVNGDVTFQYQAYDGTAYSNIATVTISVAPVNDAPVADSKTVITPEDTPVGITLSGSDVETPAGQLVLTVTTLPAHGALTYNGQPVTLNQTITGSPAALTYTPAPNYSDATTPDSFQYTVTDTGDGSAPPLTSAPATVSITVTPVNDPPTVTVDSVDNTTAITVNEGDTAVQTGTFADIDSSSVTITATMNGQPFGTISQNPGANGTWTWTKPTTDDLGPVTVTITATDSDGAQTQTSFQFTVLNVAPTILMSASTITLAAGDSFTRPGSFLDPGADTWTGMVNYGDGTGSHDLTLTGMGFALSSPAYSSGVHTVTVTITDDDGGTTTETFQVVVSQPVVLAPVDGQTVTHGDPLSLSFSFTDTPNAKYSYSINWGDPTGADNTQTGTGLTVGGDGNGLFSGSHVYKHKGTFNVFVTVTDELGNTDTITFKVTVK